MEVYEYVITTCANCVYAKEVKGCICYCSYKSNRVNISKRNKCKKFKEKK